MALVRISMSFVFVMPVVTVLLVGVFPIPAIIAVSGTIFVVTVAIGIAPFFIILVPAVIRTVLLFMSVILLFVSIPLSGLVLPIIGKSNTRAAKDYNDNNAE